VTDDGGERGPKVACSIKLVDQREGTDLDPHNVKWQPRGEGGPGGYGSKGPAQVAAVVQQGRQWLWGWPCHSGLLLLLLPLLLLLLPLLLLQDIARAQAEELLTVWASSPFLELKSSHLQLTHRVTKLSCCLQGAQWNGVI
jgi:hypothetical protein